MAPWLTKVDVLGFSMGGMSAQVLGETEPGLARRLVLVGTGPRGGEAMTSLTPEAQAAFGKTYDQPDDQLLNVFFTPSAASQAAGRAFLKRFRQRTEDRDPETTEAVAQAQLEAIVDWGSRRAGEFGYLRAIAQPALVINGTQDVFVYSVNSLGQPAVVTILHHGAAGLRRRDR
jgi:pimeloyl-ACP methyl ester carboxylesterase